MTQINKKKSSKKNSSESKIIKVRQLARTVEEVNIADYCTKLMLPFGKTVNLARAVPDMRDGLKPVGRRIQWTIFKDQKLTPSSESVKSATVVGDVIGKYHPHGDQSVYGTMVSLGLYFKYYPVLVKSGGSYGDIYGNSASAMRYTEVGMSDFTWDCFFADWEPQTVDFKPNFTNKLVEPEYLPSKFPVGLIIPSTNMGWALYAGVPSFNLIDVANLTLKLIDNPDYNKCTLIPDFPVPCDIVSTDFKKICEKGEGTFRMRSRIDEDEDGHLIIRNMPYQTTWKTVEEQIIALKNKTKIQGVDNIIDLSEGKEILDMKMKVVLKKGADKENIKETLYKSTSLEDTFVVNLEFTNDYENIHYNIKSYILDWIEFRMETKRRYLIDTYAKLSKELHTLETINEVLSKPKLVDKIMVMIRKSNRKDIIRKLIDEYNLTDLQAEIISKFQMAQFSDTSLKEYKNKYEELSNKLPIIENQLNDDMIKQSIKDEITFFKEKYGRKRICRLIEVEEEGHIPNTNHLVVITKKGYIKKLPIGQDNIGSLEQSDKVVSQLEINNRESVLIFDSAGKVYSLKISDIVSTPIDGVGIDIKNILKIESKIVGMIKKPEDKENKESVLFITEKGFIKKTELGNFNACTKNGLIGILLKEETIKNSDGKSIKEKDKLVDVVLLSKNKDILIYTRNGEALRINSKEVTPTLRSSSGVIGIRLKDDDTVLGMIEIDKKKKYFAILTTSGNAKKCLIENFDRTQRAKEGITLITFNNSKEKIASIISVNDGDDVHVSLNTRTDVFNIDEFKEASKLAKGKKLVPCKNSEHIITMY